MSYYVPGSQEKDQSKVIMSLQQAHEKTATNTTNIAANTSAIATNSAAITALQSAGQGLVNSGGSLAVSLSKLTASLGADVSLNNTANYFTGPSISQGATGTWFVMGTVTVTDTAGASNFYAKLWDGTTVIDSAAVSTSGGTNWFMTITLSGLITSPAADLRISVRDLTSANGKILFNQSGNSKDSTISAIRIA